MPFPSTPANPHAFSCLTMLMNHPRGLLVLLCFLAAITSAANLDIRLPTGTFRGTSVAGSGVEKWLGIPFAQPPVGPLRFKAPVPITRRSSAVKDASAFGNACPQLPGNLGAPISEDCLFLNVCYPPFTTAAYPDCRPCVGLAPSGSQG